MATYKLYDDFMDARDGFAGMFKLRTMTPAQIEFRQKLIENDAAPHKIKQWNIKSKEDLKAEGRENEWPSGALPPLTDPFAEFIDGEKNNQYLTDEMWEELFKDFAGALREMNSKIDRLSLEPTIKALFIDKYFKIFGDFTLNPVGRPALLALLTYIQNPAVKNELLGFQKLFSDSGKFSEFIKSIQNFLNGHPLSQEQRTMLDYVISTVDSYGKPNSYGFGIVPKPGNIDIPLEIGGPDTADFAILRNALDVEDVSTKLPEFKGKFVEIYTKIATLPKVKAAFGATTAGRNITAYMEEAEEIYDFNKKESENFIDEKIEDELNPIEAFKKNFDDKRQEHFGRFKRRFDGWEFENKQAEAIVEAMYKEGFTPQQGLDWIVTNKDKVISRLGAGHESVGRWKWLVAELELAKTKEKKAFAGALYNGQKLKAIKEEMKVNAPKTGAKAKYMVASEVLTVIQYEDFSTFTDQEMFKDGLAVTKNLSFAKEGPMKQMAEMFDKTIELGIKGGIRVAKVGIRKANKFIAGLNKTKRLGALEKKLNLDKTNAASVLDKFGATAAGFATQIKNKEDEIADIQKSIDVINETENGKQLKELTDERKKIEENIVAMQKSIDDKNVALAMVPPGVTLAARITRQRDIIQMQMTAYMTRHAVTAMPMGTPPTIAVGAIGIDVEITPLTAAIAARLGALPGQLAAEEANLAILKNNLQTDLEGNGFEQWEYDRAKEIANTAQTKIDDLAEMNTFDKKLEAKTRNLNPFTSIKDQRKAYYLKLETEKQAA